MLIVVIMIYAAINLGKKKTPISRGPLFMRLMKSQLLSLNLESDVLSRVG